MAPLKSQGSTKVSAAKKCTSAKGKGGKSKKMNSSIEDVEKRILSNMANRLVFGATECSQHDVLSFAGYKYPTAERFHQTKKSLLAKGLVEYTSSTKTYRLTEAGIAQAPAVEAATKVEKPTSNEMFHKQIKDHYFKEAKAFPLLEKLNDGRPHERLKVCNDLGYKFQTAQAFAKAVAELKNLGFLEPAGSGLFQLTDKAFPCGRPEQYGAI
jgi:hypothetical protein